MKTYIILIKHKTHWLHLASAILILSVFTSVALLQYAGQQFVSANAPTARLVTPSYSRKLHPSATPPVPPSIAAVPKTSPVQMANLHSSPAQSPVSSSTTPAAAPTAPPPAPVRAPVSDIASATTCPGQTSLGNVSAVLACMTAYARTQHGLNPTTSNAALNAAATAKVQDMSDCGYSHEACNRVFNYWFAVKGFAGRCTAENIAMGQLTPGQVFNDWMNSAGHRANILNPSYSAIGAAVSVRPSGNLWAMELGGC